MHKSLFAVVDQPCTGGSLLVMVWTGCTTVTLTASDNGYYGQGAGPAGVANASIGVGVVPVSQSTPGEVKPLLSCNKRQHQCLFLMIFLLVGFYGERIASVFVCFLFQL